jgi:hypothetical protein
VSCWSLADLGESRLVGEHDELGAVADGEFGHGPADVGLGGERAHDEPGGDLLVGEPAWGDRRARSSAGLESGRPRSVGTDADALQLEGLKENTIKPAAVLVVPPSSRAPLLTDSYTHDVPALVVAAAGRSPAGGVVRHKSAAAASPEAVEAPRIASLAA